MSDTISSAAVLTGCTAAILLAMWLRFSRRVLLRLWAVSKRRWAARTAAHCVFSRPQRYRQLSADILTADIRTDGWPTTFHIRGSRYLCLWVPSPLCTQVQLVK